MILLLDNYDSFTYNIYQYLCELTSEEIKVVRNDAVTVAQIQALKPAKIILSPGPGRPEEAGCMIDVLKSFAGKVPILGICLGHQAIGYAFGADVIGAKAIIHGKTQPISVDGKGIFRGLPNPSTFTRYHSLVIDAKTLPADIVVSAWSPDGEVMAVRHTKYPIEGVQFHPESIASEGGKQMLKNFLNYAVEPFPFKRLLTKLIERQDLTRDEAAAFMEELTEGNLTSAQIAAFLVAFNSKGIAAEEIAGCVSVLGKKRTPLNISGDFLDIVGTGGDEIGTFNISSMAALTAAAAGATVAKHGNRAVSSKSGSADFYTALGLKIDLKPELSVQVLQKTHFAFLFAPVYHGAMRHAAPVRKELGIKSIMNLLGPLANPAAAPFQLIGVWSDDIAPMVAKAAHLLGVKKALVVWGSDGLDEISVSAPSHLYSVNEAGEVEKMVFDPASLGIGPYTLADIAGGTGEENARLAVDLLEGRGSPAIRDAVCLNAGAGLWVCGKAADIEDGYRQCLQAFKTGRVKALVEQVVALTKELA